MRNVIAGITLLALLPTWVWPALAVAGDPGVTVERVRWEFHRDAKWGGWIPNAGIQDAAEVR